MIKILLSGFFILLTYINFHAIIILMRKEALSQAGIWFLAGALAGLVSFHFLNRFEPLYVFGHELAHWLAAKLCLRKTGRFRLGMQSGSVEIDNANTFILLAPYFYPTLSILWIPVWLLIDFFYPHPIGLSIFFLLLGSSYAHHIYMTLRLTFLIKQSDFDKPGKAYSTCIILFANSFVIFIILALLSPLRPASFYHWAQACISIIQFLKQIT